MQVHVLGTGSSGNALLVEADDTRLLVEAGIGPRNAAVRARALGVDLFPRGLRVRTIGLAHDAPHVALAIESKTHTLGFLTDVGSITPPVVEFLASCDTVLLESNFCPQLLELGPYPRSLRRRIAGHLGHLSNEQAASLAGTIARQGTSRIVLCHLSQVNNEPERALRVVRERARDVPVDVLPHGKSRTLHLAPQPRRGYEQLELF